MARQPMVRPDSAETQLNHDPPVSAEVTLSQRSHQSSDHSSVFKNGTRQTSSAAFDEVLRLIAGQACLATSANASAIALYDGDEIVCRATAGTHAPELGARLDPSSGLTGACVRTRQVQYCEDTDSDPRVNSAACRRLQVRSVMVAPLLFQSELLGIIEIFSPFPQAFARHDLQNLEALSQVLLDHFRSATDSAPFPSDDEPLFASATETSGAEIWVGAPASPGEPASSPLELSAIRWEPPGAYATFPEPARAEQISQPAAEYSSHPGHELFSPHLESFPPPVSEPPAVIAPEPKIEPLPPPRPAPVPPVVIPPSSQRVAVPPSAQPRDWATSFLTLTVIAVALLLGWMLGHAGWQRVVGAAKTAVASSSQRAGTSSARGAAADASDPTAVEASDAVFPAPAKSSLSANHVPTPSQPTSSLRKTAPDASRDGGLVVYEGGKIIFQQTAPPSKPGHLTKNTDAEPSSAGNTPSDPVSLSPEDASAYLMRRIEPVYPEEARQQNIEGEVHLEALVGKDGTVQVLRLVSGNSQLAQAAADAVRQWRFRPYKFNGRAAPFSTRLTVSFRLQ